MEKMGFYQSIDLPSGHHKGSWDHRGSTDVYLGHTNFSGKTALDIGPGSGFWSFEMEKRGAAVTAIELGPDDRWDAVPHGGKPAEWLSEALTENVGMIHRAMTYSSEQLGSKVQIMRGSAYDVPTLVEHADIALMGNILQHLRDPFLAIERVASVVDRIIISETLWTDDDAFMNSATMRLLPRAESPEINHSWYQVSPPWIGEVLKILGFGNLRNEIHDQLFLGSSSDHTERMVKHFTYSADRMR